jgi:SAM-dependent methyltransferase
MPLRACPICQAETPASCEIGDLAPTVQTASGTDKYTLSYCGCGELVFVSPEPTGDDLDLIYRQNEQFFGFYRDPAYIKQAHQWHTNTLYGLLSETYGRNVVFGRLRLLEIGSGLAWMCRAAKALSPDFTTVAQDVTPEVSGECPWVDHYLVGEIDDLRFDKFAPFDVISMTRVIEHLVDPVAMLRRARALLNPDGLLFITAPHRPKGWGTDASIERWRQWSYNHVPVHLQYFSEASFKRAAETAGLSLAGWYLPGDGEVFEARLRPAREVTMIAMAPVRPAVAANGKAAAGLFERHLDPHLSDAATQAELRERFESAEPFPWIVVEIFCNPTSSSR